MMWFSWADLELVFLAGYVCGVGCMMIVIVVWKILDWIEERGW
jgi:hypothetical protein